MVIGYETSEFLLDDYFELSKLYLDYCPKIHCYPSSEFGGRLRLTTKQVLELNLSNIDKKHQPINFFSYFRNLKPYFEDIINNF